MKVKTSVTLSEDLLDAMDTVAARYGSRSQLMEAALRTFLVQLERREQDARDLDILNGKADRLNAEAQDVLEYQVDL